MSIPGIGALIIFVGLGVGMYNLKANEPDVAMSASWRSQSTQVSLDHIDHNRRGPTVCREYAAKSWFWQTVTAENRWCGEWLKLYGKDHGITS